MQTAAEVAGIAKGHDPTVEFAVTAGREALAGSTAAPARRALVFGTSLGDHPGGVHRLAELVADALAIEGPRITLSTACTSSTHAAGLAADLLADGAADEVLAGGSDRLSPEILAGFEALGLLARDGCTPFGPATGTTLGEGAGFVRLRSEPSPLAIVGYGLSADAYHATTPDPSGAGVARAIEGALRDAGVALGAIDYVNAHATGTSTNDPAEWRALERVFGAHAPSLRVSGSKGMLGHAQGAAGVLELLVTLAALSAGKVPPTVRTASPRPRAPTGLVLDGAPPLHAVDHAVCTNSAFAGANAAVVVTTRPVPPRPSRERHPVHLRAWATAFSDEPLDLADLAPDLDPRGLDPMSRHLTAAAARALRAGDLAVRGAARDRTGLFVGTLRVSPESARAFRASIEERGLTRLSPTAFTRMVLNAPAGVCTRALGLRGPTTTVTIGDGSGLLSLVLAARWLSHRDDADVLLAGGVDERDADEGEGRTGAVVGALVRGECAGPPVLGFAIRGPGRAAEAAEAARVMAGVDRDEALVAKAGRRAIGGLEALVVWDRSRPLLLVESSRSASCALLLGRSPEHG